MTLCPPEWFVPTPTAGIEKRTEWIYWMGELLDGLSAGDRPLWMDDEDPWRMEETDERD